MKGLVKALAILVVAVPLLACEKKKSEKETINSRRSSRGYDVGREAFPRDASGRTTSPTAGYSTCSFGGTYGGVTKGDASQDEFTNQVNGFVSHSLNPYSDPAEIGYVSGEYDDDTGVRFCGRVETSSAMSGYTSSRTTIRSGNFDLAIYVFDTYAGETDASGDVIDPYTVYFSSRQGHSIEGEVNGSQAWVRFNQPGQGWVELSGVIEGGYFYGSMWFDNQRYWDGQTPGAANTLGFFYVPTCGFFRCQ